jgi:hypothetical protein
MTEAQFELLLAANREQYEELSNAIWPRFGCCAIKMIF